MPVEGLFILFVLAIVAILVAVALVIALVAFVRAVQKNRKLAQHGVETEADVISHRQEKVYRSVGSQYYITYRYEAIPPLGTKTTFTHEENVWLAVYDKYPVGSRFKVRYLPDDPKVVQRSATLIGLKSNPD
jgi:hypothetical protein